MIKAEIVEWPRPGVLEALDREWLDSEGRLRLLPASAFLSVDPNHFRIWCLERARYIVPTVELVEFLRERIGGRKAIEIGAGNADLGHHLGITMTDSRVQERHPAMRYVYKMGGQRITTPPRSVLTMEAETAVNKLRPRVVIGAWVSRKFIEGVDVENVSEAFVFGPVEEDIIRKVEMYIHVGAYHIHGAKTALSLPHEEIQLPGLISRVKDQGSNVIYIWGK